MKQDKLFDYIEAKKRIYVTTLITRSPLQIVGFDVACDTIKKLIQKIVDNSKKQNFTILMLTQVVKMCHILENIFLSW